MIEFTCFALLALCALAVLGQFLPAIVDAVAPDLGDACRTGEFYDDASQRGLSFREASDELDIRTLFAGVRREASEATERDPDGYIRHIDAAMTRAIDELKARRRHDLIPVLTGMRAGLSYNHVLYQTASTMVDRLPIGGYVPMSQDRRAALRIVKPSR